MNAWGVGASRETSAESDQIEEGKDCVCMCLLTNVPRLLPGGVRTHHVKIPEWHSFSGARLSTWPHLFLRVKDMSVEAPFLSGASGRHGMVICELSVVSNLLLLENLVGSSEIGEGSSG